MPGHPDRLQGAQCNIHSGCYLFIWILIGCLCLGFGDGYNVYVLIACTCKIKPLSAFSIGMCFIETYTVTYVFRKQVVLHPASSICYIKYT